MKLFDASFETVLYRYYLLMAVVVVSFVIGLPWLAFLALPIFLSAFMGINFKPMFKRFIKKGGQVQMAATDRFSKAA